MFYRYIRASLYDKHGFDIENIVKEMKSFRYASLKSDGVIKSSKNDGLFIAISQNRITVNFDSYKYFDGNYSINNKDIKVVFDGVSQIIKKDFLNANVSTISFGDFYEMTSNVPLYLDRLHLCDSLKRNRISHESLVYRSKSKRKEILFKGESENILEYRVTWHRRLSKQLDEPDLNLATLFSDAFIIKISKMASESFMKITKRTDPLLSSYEKIKTVSDATDFICAVALQKLSPDDVQNIFDDMKKKQVFSDRKYYTRLKNKLSDMSSKTDTISIDCLANELNDKIIAI